MQKLEVNLPENHFNTIYSDNLTYVFVKTRLPDIIFFSEYLKFNNTIFKKQLIALLYNIQYNLRQVNKVSELFLKYNDLSLFSNKRQAWLKIFIFIFSSSDIYSFLLNDYIFFRRKKLNTPWCHYKNTLYYSVYTRFLCFNICEFAQNIICFNRKWIKIYKIKKVKNIRYQARSISFGVYYNDRV